MHYFFLNEVANLANSSFFQAPSDDGGSPVTQYKIEMRDVDRRSWNDVGQFDDAYF